MYVDYNPDQDEILPLKSRPLLRYRQEKFGYLAAFPSGRLAFMSPAAGDVLALGQSLAKSAPFFLRKIDVPVDFHFAAPLIVWIEITRRCNLRCPHCFIEGGVKRAWELPTERVIELINELAGMGVFALVITGGEPTLHPGFLDIVNHAHSLGFVIGIATNGVLLRGKLAEKLPRDDVIISMSIDGLHGQGVHRESDFEATSKRLLDLKARGFEVSVMTTTTHENVGSLAGIIRWAVDNDVSLRSVPFIASGRGAHNGHLLNVSSDVQQVAEFWLEEEKWEREKDKTLGLCVGKVLNFLHTVSFATRRCMSGRGVCYVSSNGDVFPCTTCASQKALCPGNIRFASLRQIWESQDWDIRRITWKLYETVCEGCPINSEKLFCPGRCPGSSMVLNKRVDGCGATAFQRESIQERERLFRQNIRSEPIVFVGRPE